MSYMQVMFSSFLFPVSVPFSLLMWLSSEAFCSLFQYLFLCWPRWTVWPCSASRMTSRLSTQLPGMSEKIAVQCTLYCLQCKYTSISLYSLTGGRDQREGLDLLEYQAMPSLRDVAHEGWLCTFTIQQSSWKFRQLPSGQVLSGQPLLYRKDRRYVLSCPSHTKSHLPGHPSPASQAGPPCWASPLSFGLIGRDPRRRLVIRKQHPQLSLSDSAPVLAGRRLGRGIYRSASASTTLPCAAVELVASVYTPVQ